MQNIRNDVAIRLLKLKDLLTKLEVDLFNEDKDRVFGALNIAGGLIYLVDIMFEELDKLKSEESLRKKMRDRFIK